MKTPHVIMALSLVVGIYFSGPVVQFPAMDVSHVNALPQAPSELDAWLIAKESAFQNIKKNNEKTIVWANNKREKTPWSVVYIHGFSSSRLETAPLAERVGQSLHANVFYTRLTGHGQEPKDLGEATPNDWMNDYWEAIAIGQRLGHRVLVISCSTGSTIATLASSSGALLRQASSGQNAPGAAPHLAAPENAPEHAPQAHVFISPNFGPKDPRAEIILTPWGQELAFWIEGQTHRSPSEGPEEDLGWYKEYPTKALFPMMYMVKMARESHLENFTHPLLVLYSERDQVVDVKRIKTAFNAMRASPKTLVAVDYSESLNQHVLAGRIKAPKALSPMAEEITQWVKTLDASQGFK